MKICRKAIKASIDYDPSKYYDLYTEPHEIESWATEFDMNGDELIAEQEELLEPYGMTFVGVGFAKDEYYDKLANDGEEFVTVADDGSGNLTYGIFVGDRFCPVSLARFSWDEDEEEWDEEIESATNLKGNLPRGSQATYRNKRNENKYVEVKKGNDGHSYSRLYMKWDTPEGEVKNYTGAKDAKRGRYYRTNLDTIDQILDDYDEVEESSEVPFDSDPIKPEASGEAFSVYDKNKYYGGASSLEGAKRLMKKAYETSFHDPEDIVVVGDGYQEDMYGLFDFEFAQGHKILKASDDLITL